MNDIEDSSDVAVEGLYMIFKIKHIQQIEILEQKMISNVERNDTASNVRWYRPR